MRTLSQLVLVALLAGIPGPATVAASEPFVEIQGRLLAPARNGQVLIRIDSLYRIGSDGASERTDTLQVSCPSAGISNWRTFFHTGDTMTLEWRVERAPRRGWLFFGGGGGVALLTFPAEGIPKRCACRGKSGEINLQLVGTFITNEGTSSEIRRRGRSESFFGRLLPFWRGGHPTPPQQVKLRLGWMPSTNNSLTGQISTR